MGALKRNNVVVTGKGRQPLVLVHGFGCSQKAWRRLVPQLELDYRVVCLDLTGCGGSDVGAYDAGRYASLDAHADDLLEVLAALSLNGVYVVGHSCGAMIALLAAVKAPHHFGKLATLGGSARYLDDVDGYRGGMKQHEVDGLVQTISADFAAWAIATAPYAVDEPPHSPLAAELISSFCAQRPEIAAHFARVIFNSDLREVLPKLSHDTLVIQAAHDPFVPQAAAEHLVRHIPRAKINIVQGRGGHFPHMGSPHEVMTMLREFFEGPLALHSERFA